MDWAQVRAGAIAGVLVVCGVIGAPVPSSYNAKQLESEAGQAELDRWVHMLGSVGIEVRREDLGALSLSVGQGSSQLRKDLVKPLRPGMRWTGTNQRWGLFAYPDTHPHFMVIEARSGREPWERLHRTLDDEHTFLAPQLRFRRLRGLWTGFPKKGGERWRAFTQWVAGQVFEARPDVDAVRVSFERVRTTLPGEPPDTPVRKRSRIVRRGAEL